MEDRNAMPTEAMVEAFRKKLDALPKTDRGINYEKQYRWGGSPTPRLTTYGELAEFLKWVLDNTEALSAALAHPGQGREIAIKPLTWRGDFAHTEFGLFYHITERGADLCCVLEKHTDSSETKSFWLSVEEAKAAAQSDYDQRIRSALVTSDTGVEA